jgi:hypothetical protein
LWFHAVECTPSHSNMDCVWRATHVAPKVQNSPLLLTTYVNFITQDFYDSLLSFNTILSSESFTLFSNANVLHLKVIPKAVFIQDFHFFIIKPKKISRNLVYITRINEDLAV